MAGQGACIFGCAGERLSVDEAAFFRDANPWGFILFARNIDTPEQLKRLTGDLREAVGRDAVVTIDQEGGRVERMTRPHWRHWLPALDQVDLNPAQAERGMYIRYRIIADELRAVGIDSNCAPIADVATPQTHWVLRNRCYSDDPAKVASIGRAVADGLLDGGVLPVLKHIPGHGRATLDSHKELPRVSANRAGLEAVDFAAMQALADLPMGMSAHIVFEDIDASGPATTSPVMVDLIRKDIGFSGLLMSDDLSMQALEGDVSTRARKSRDAGIDLILHCNGKMPEMQMVVDAVGNFTPDGQKRADLAINARKSPDNVDIPALEDELAGLLKRA